MSCASDYGYQAIGWSYVPVGGSPAVYIATGPFVYDAQNQSYAVEQMGGQQINLIILIATMERAGTYICVDVQAHQASAQLIIISTLSIYPIRTNTQVF